MHNSRQIMRSRSTQSMRYRQVTRSRQVMRCRSMCLGLDEVMRSRCAPSADQVHLEGSLCLFQTHISL